MSPVQVDCPTVGLGTRDPLDEPVGSATRPSLVVGGRYRLVGKLGSGGFGQVWKARDQALDVDVAVKETWLPPLPEQERAKRLARAEREARNAARLRDHPNIVAVHDVVVEEGIPWIVMRLVAGRSLEEQIRMSGPLPADAAVSVAAGLLNALGAAHRAGVIHRDVKPANVMLADGGEVLLTDFGTAVHQADTALTPTGSFIGTAEYIAPERIDGADAQAASDLFSLGVTLYRAVEGFSPFHRDSLGGTLRAILRSQPPPPKRAGRLAGLITALLEKEPARRPTVSEGLALIEAPTPETRRHPGPRRRRGGMVTAASGSALALATVGAAVLPRTVADEHPPACVRSDIGRDGTLPSPSGMLPNTPHAPSLIAPADQTMVSVGQPVTFRWAGSAGVAKIRLALSRNGAVPAGGWKVSDWRRPSSCSFTPTVPGLYLWEVTTARSADRANASGWSEQRYLLVRPARRTINMPQDTPRPPSPTSPSDQADVMVGQPIALAWKTSARYSSVRIYSPGGGWRVSPWQSSRSYTFTPSAPGLYYWAVSAGNGTGIASGNSEERYLVVHER